LSFLKSVKTRLTHENIFGAHILILKTGMFPAWNTQPRRTDLRFFHGTPYRVEKKSLTGTLLEKKKVKVKKVKKKKVKKKKRNFVD
jgi:hypothetical protein